MPATPPAAERRPHTLELHGHRRTDDWYWLRDAADPDVAAHLAAENAYADELCAPLQPLADRIAGEIRHRVVEDDATVPVRWGHWEYFTRTREGAAYPIHYRRPARAVSPDTLPHRSDVAADEAVVLDENAEVGGGYFACGGVHPSGDGTLLGWLGDTAGDERFTLHVRDLTDSGDVVDVVVADDVAYGLAWGESGRWLYYVRHDDTLRPCAVWRAHLDDRPHELVWEEPDERFAVSLGATRDGRWAVIASHATTTSETHLLDAANPAATPVAVRTRRDGVEYHVEHQHADGADRLWVITNADGAANFKLCRADLTPSGVTAWRDVIAERDDRRLDGVTAYAHHLLLTVRQHGDAALAVYPLDGSGERPVRLGDTPATCWAAPGDPDGGDAVVGWTSLAAPDTACVLNLATGAVTTLAQRQVRGYDPDDYATERVWATADDGCAIPISLLWRPDAVGERPAPCVLYGYGSYEHSVDVAFSAARLSLVDRGVVYAIAHVRGGGEGGRAWYEQGRGLAKRTTFTDFVACARWLVDSGRVDPARLACRGRSAGGLLVGAAVNLAPDLFAAAVAEVPFVDAVTTMSDPTIPLTTGEWDEWGNPADDEAAYRAMLGWSPYDNVAAAPYPALYVTAGLADPRVGFWEPVKWVQRLRERTTSNNPVVLRVDVGGGHFGPSGRYAAWDEEARTTAWVLDALGVGDDKRQAGDSPTTGAAAAG
jgi:oligopeptidase B